MWRIRLQPLPSCPQHLQQNNIQLLKLSLSQGLLRHVEDLLKYGSIFTATHRGFLLTGCVSTLVTRSSWTIVEFKRWRVSSSSVSHNPTPILTATSTSKATKPTSLLSTKKPTCSTDCRTLEQTPTTTPSPSKALHQTRRTERLVQRRDSGAGSAVSTHPVAQPDVRQRSMKPERQLAAPCQLYIQPSQSQE